MTYINCSYLLIGLISPIYGKGDVIAHHSEIFNSNHIVITQGVKSLKQRFTIKNINYTFCVISPTYVDVV